jgi:cytochrome oxidase assembly protein ShyY1
MVEVGIVCVTVLIGLVLILMHLGKHQTERAEWQEALRNELLEKVDARLSKQADYRKDLETVNKNQLLIADELKLLKQTSSIRTSLGKREIL